MKSILIPIYFLNGSHYEINFESYTLIGELKANLMKQMKFHRRKIHYYCLYEICYKNKLIGNLPEYHILIHSLISLKL